MKGFQIDAWRGRFGVSLSSEYPGSPFEQLRLPLGDLVGMEIELLASSASDFSPLTAAKATFA
jgi:hypothetical protein